jgi:hypothetical protein
VLFGAGFTTMGVGAAIAVSLIYSVLWLMVDGTIVRGLIARPAT